MAENQGNLAGTTGQGCRVFYNDSGTFREVQGIGQMQVAVGAAATNTYSAFEGSFATVGDEEIAQVTFEVGSIAPNHPSWRWLDAQRDAKKDVTLYAETKESLILTADAKTKISAAASGAGKTSMITLAEGSTTKKTIQNIAARGHCIKIGSALHTIVSISDDEADADVDIEIVKPASAISDATGWTIVQPILRWIVTGGIAQMGGATVARDAAVSSELVIQPRSRVPLATPVAAHIVA